MTALLLALSLLQTPASSDQTVYPIGSAVAAPQPITRPIPRYTDAARQAGTQGEVWLTCIVEADGRVTNIRIQRGLDPGLDEEAVKALEQWRFSPGMKDGRPVRVQVTVQMSFNVRGGAITPPPTSIVVFRRTESDGRTISFEIADERFQRLPVWDPSAIAAPPLAAADAIRAANDWVNASNPIPGSFVVLTIMLRRFPDASGTRWFYAIDFTPASRNPQSAAPLTTAVVLLDGSIVEPHR